MASEENIPRTAALTVIWSVGIVGLFAMVIVVSRWSVLAALAAAGAALLIAMRYSARASAAHSERRAEARALEIAEHEARMAARLATEEAEALALLEAEESYRRDLVERFGEANADHIVAGDYWQGATFEMIEESVGEPDDIKESVYKSKTKTTYLYRPISAQRYGLKVHFENGVVVGWDD